MVIPRIPLRIAVVQFCPKIGQVQANISRARDLCAKFKPQSVDLVCLPEMIFTGYVFSNVHPIAPYLEHPKTGPTSLFCAELAARLKCYVAAGYPERLEPHETEKNIDNDGVEVEKIGANSAVLYGPSGEWVGGYRKTNLFEKDTWAKAGTGFATFSLPSPLHTVSLGICMDLNPQPPTPWTRSEGPYELADHCLQNKSRLLILLNSWLDSKEELNKKHDWSTLNYWAARLRPLWTNGDDENCLEEDEDESESDADKPAEQGQDTIVVVCNRCGEENGTVFAGTSAIFTLRQGSGRPTLMSMMDRHEEGVRVWTV